MNRAEQALKNTDSRDLGLNIPGAPDSGLMDSDTARELRRAGWTNAQGGLTRAGRAKIREMQG